MNIVGPDGQPVASASDQARGVQHLATSVIQGLNQMPRFRAHLDACHAHLAKKGEKPSGSQADTLASLKLVADFQDRAEKLLAEVRARAALVGADEVGEVEASDLE